MKKMEIEQMEIVSGGIKDVKGCVSNVTSGMGLLWSAVAVSCFATNPVGWVILGVSAISYATADHTACDD